MLTSVYFPGSGWFVAIHNNYSKPLLPTWWQCLTGFSNKFKVFLFSDNTWLCHYKNNYTNSMSPLSMHLVTRLDFHCCSQHWTSHLFLERHLSTLPKYHCLVPSSVHQRCVIHLPTSDSWVDELTRASGLQNSLHKLLLTFCTDSCFPFLERKNNSLSKPVCLSTFFKGDYFFFR